MKGREGERGLEGEEVGYDDTLSMPKLSVIIPTYRRAEILAECVRRLERQTIVSDIEVIIVSDGHDEKTSALFAKPPWLMPVKFFEIEKNQQGAARNQGIAHATADVVCFIGDDIFLEPDACEAHLTVHHSANTPIAVLGYTTWDPVVGITPVMSWLETSGWQFGYPKISQCSGTFLPREIQHRFSYTSHISLPLSEAKKNVFRPDVHLYGWEDIEWGMRLKNSGVRLYYEPRAKALHHHRMTLEDSLKRMETLGRSAVDIQKKVPEFDRVPKGWKLWAYRFAALLPTIAGKHRKAFLVGLFTE